MIWHKSMESSSRKRSTNKLSLNEDIVVNHFVFLLHSHFTLLLLLLFGQGICRFLLFDDLCFGFTMKKICCSFLEKKMKDTYTTFKSCVQVNNGHQFLDKKCPK